MRRLGDQAGVTLIETIVTLVIVCTGMLATMGVFASSGRATLTAQQKTAMVALAEREIERLRPLPYDKIGLSGAVPAGAPALKGPAAAEPPATGGVVAPGPEAFAVDGVRGRIYRFVTWRTQSCPAVKGKVAEQVAASVGLPVDDVAAQLTDLCPGSQQTKRVVVVVVADHAGGETRPPGAVQLQTVAVDAQVGALANGSFEGLKVDVRPIVEAARNPQVPEPQQTYAAVTQQTHFLHDTPCSFTARQAIGAHHDTHDTGVVGATCSGSRVPDLMSLAPIPGASNDLLFDYSADIERDARGGLALLRDDRAGPCDGDWRYTGPEADERSDSVHTWATNQTATAAELAPAAGRGLLNLWVSGTERRERAVRLCAVVWRESTAEVLGFSDYQLPSVQAGQIQQLSLAFDVAGVALAAGERVMLTLRVPADSQGDLNLYFDHAAYASGLTLPMKAGLEMSG